MSGDAVAAAVEALRAGQPAILPTDTVYGLCCSPYRPGPAERMYRLKGRDTQQPTALIATDLEALFELVPELRGRAGVIARALLPGPYTLVLSNPARRYGWLTGMNPDAIGVRVPELPEAAAAVVAQVGGVAATSANLSGGPDPRRLEDVPGELRAQAAAVDAGELPGTPSTVLDFTGEKPRVIREGAADGASAIERAVAALA
ncbi:MAG TPA: L-threonylcarbamoyladenylate synthase [Gaiellaceae bacterium]|nr:L-threonylcarbamoyladenylate synthase [Gaiellaceae bacterium]